MKEDDLDREGMHAFCGKETLEGFIRWAYEHMRLHEGDIREVLGQQPRLQALLKFDCWPDL
jgi:hypothetical protein